MYHSAQGGHAYTIAITSAGFSMITMMMMMMMVIIIIKFNSIYLLANLTALRPITTRARLELRKYIHTNKTQKQGNNNNNNYNNNNNNGNSIYTCKSEN
jgi:hypothetical protein